MENVNLANWIIGIICLFTAVILFILGVMLNLINKHNKEIAEYQKTNLSISTIQSDISILAKFIGNPNFSKAVDFFSNQNAQNFSDSIAHVSDLNLQLKEQGDKLGRVIQLAMKHLFNEVSGRIHEHLENNELFTKRLNEYKESKLYLMNNYLKIEAIQKVIRNENAIFIESGSTMSYIILPLIDNLIEYRPKNKGKLKICTNNVLIFMLLLFEENINPVLLKGVPKNKYGATFGVEGEKDICKKKNVIAFLKKHEVKVLFTAASVMDLKYGPHVSSVANQQLKSAVFEYFKDTPDCENFTFIVAEKINNDIEEIRLSNECRLVFNTKGHDEFENSRSSVEFLFRDTLNNQRNHIITASTEIKVFEEAINNFKKRYDFLNDWKIGDENGGLGILYH